MPEPDYFVGEGGESMVGEGAGEAILPEYQPPAVPEVMAPSPASRFITIIKVCNPT